MITKRINCGFDPLIDYYFPGTSFARIPYQLAAGFRTLIKNCDVPLL
jgi:hypothetical protein